MSFDKLLTNMQKMFTGFSDNGNILNDLQNIRLIFQKVQNPILTQIKSSLQVSYDLDQANTGTYDFIYKSKAAEAASLWDHTPPRSSRCQHLWQESTRERHQGSRWRNIHRVLPQLVQSIRQRETIYLWQEGATQHQGWREAQVFWQEKQIRAASINSKKIRRLRRSNARSHIWKTSVRNLKNIWAQMRKQMNIRTMRATSLVDAKVISSKKVLTGSLGVCFYIG